MSRSFAPKDEPRGIQRQIREFVVQRNVELGRRFGGCVHGSEDLDSRSSASEVVHVLPFESGEEVEECLRRIEREPTEEDRAVLGEEVAEVVAFFGGPTKGRFEIRICITNVRGRKGY